MGRLVEETRDDYIKRMTDGLIRLRLALNYMGIYDTREQIESAIETIEKRRREQINKGGEGKMEHKCKLEDIDWEAIDITDKGHVHYPGTCRICGRQFGEVLKFAYRIDAKTGKEVDLK